MKSAASAAKPLRKKSNDRFAAVKYISYNILRRVVKHRFYGSAFFVGKRRAVLLKLYSVIRISFGGIHNISLEGSS